VSLSASRGVIRADTPEDLDRAVAQVFRLLDREAAQGNPVSRRVLVEEYIPGSEVALEGLLMAGRLQTLALFDKPDPLEGPFFPETIYVTPSRLEPAIQADIRRCAGQAAQALSLEEGPIHGEFRLNSAGVWDFLPEQYGSL
jgi:biotin carboxylase